MNEILRDQIKDLFITFRYQDYSNVGKDDNDSDYVVISNINNRYLKICIEKVLNEEYGRPIDIKVTYGEYLLESRMSFNINPCARYPRSSYYLNSDLENYVRLLLLDKISTFYDEEKYFEECVYSNKYYQYLSSFTLGDLNIKKEIGYFTINANIISEDKQIDSYFEFKLIVENFGNKICLINDSDYEKCKKITTFNIVEKIFKLNSDLRS